MKELENFPIERLSSISLLTLLAQISSLSLSVPCTLFDMLKVLTDSAF
jgi:hypothetical protein